MSARPVPDGAEVDHLDLADPRVHAEHDLSQVWRWLRDEQPVFWNTSRTGPGFWVVTRYADVTAVYRDTRRFSSRRGNLLTSLLAGGDSAGGRMIAVSDGPRHSALRSLLSPWLGPRVLARVEARVRATTRQLLDDVVRRGSCDFARDVAAHIPLATICDLLGVPASDQAFIKRQTSVALGSDNPTQSPVEVRLARNEILLYFRGLARNRRADPRDDLVSVLACGRVGGEEIDEDEVVVNCYSLILGGDETTRLSMAGAVAALATRPDEWNRLRGGDIGLATAVEEVLRWTTPALHAGRTAVVDTTLRGRTIRAGDIVTVWNASANQDEREFRDPGRFDLGRSPNRHLSFGYGAHFCLGASLARIEIGALLSTLRTLVSTVELTGEPRRIFSNFLAGFSSLPVAFTPAPNGSRP